MPPRGGQDAQKRMICMRAQPPPPPAAQPATRRWLPLAGAFAAGAGLAALARKRRHA